MADDQPVFGNRYQIVRHIARGGMAQVYLARDLLLDRLVALKVLFPELSVDESFVERFRREAQAAANLSHPNIVSIYDWGQGDRTYYIVMEYMDGDTLSARIRRSPLAAREAAGIAVAVAGALSFAHRHNVIHRDVKPGNVLIDRSGHLKVADFGIARAVGTSEDITQAGAVMGTATYFSPEQAQGQVVDARSDVYSLGVVLYEMVAGRPPFGGDSPVAIAYKHVSVTPPSLRSVDPAIPEGYEAIVAKSMAKAPDDRYQTADALRVDLERFRGGLAVAASSGEVIDATTIVRTGGVDATTALAGVTQAVGALDATRVERRAVPAPVGRGPGAADVARRPDEDAPTPAVARRSRSGRYAVLLLLLVAVLAVLGYVIGRDLGTFGGARTLTVPTVANQTASSATATLRADGFSHVAEARVPSSSVTTGDAIGTDPAAGSRERSDRQVVVEVSSGPPPVGLSPVDGKPQAQALQILHHQGFSTNVSQQASDTVPAGDVIRTDPPAGTPEQPGVIKVEVIVSSGREQVSVPSLVYDTPSVAGAQLSQLGFDVTQKTEPSSSVPSGEVTRTSPPAGGLVPAGTVITVYVSSGPVMVTVPSFVVGETEHEAFVTLTKLGLHPDFTSETVTVETQNGLVQSTDPVGGMAVAKGSAVSVVIGTYTAPTTTTTTTTSTTTTTTTTTVPVTTLPTLPPPTSPGELVGRRGGRPSHRSSSSASG